MSADAVQNALFRAIFLASSVRGGLVCVRKVASRERCSPADVLDAMRLLERMGLLDILASEVPGLMRVKWGAKALQAVFLFAINAGVIGADETPARRRKGAAS